MLSKNKFLFHIDFSSIFRRFWLRFGGSWGGFGKHLAVQNGPQKGNIHFFDKITIFKGFTEGLGRVLGGFWEGFGRVLGGFWPGLELFGRSRAFQRCFSFFWLFFGRWVVFLNVFGFFAGFFVFFRVFAYFHSSNMLLASMLEAFLLASAGICWLLLGFAGRCCFSVFFVGFPGLCWNCCALLVFSGLCWALLGVSSRMFSGTCHHECFRWD